MRVSGLPARRWSGPSVRTKVLGSVLVIAATGMAVAETASYLVQSERLDVRIDANLRQEAQEFRALASQGLDPRTGTRFTDVEQLLRTALARNVADDNESFLALVDDEPRYTPLGERAVQLEDVPALLRAVRAVPEDGGEVLGSSRAEVGRLRWIAVPVALGDGPSGTYVVAYAVDLERRMLVDTARTYTAVAVVSLLLLALVGSVVVGRVLRPLHLLRDAAQRIADTDAEADFAEPLPVRGDDDVADLTRSFNAMLERLRRAFEEQRQLIDDAGHELRTPVTIVRGHLELLDPHDPQEVAETRDLLLDELDRTSRLVEDLILLAKARRPDFVRAEEVDVGRLTDDVLDLAGALGDRRWRAGERADVVVDGDRHRLTQALLQLAANAVRFSAAGSAVEIGSRATDDEVRLWVRDEGVGVHEQDRERIFERFGRASVGRGAGGSGLGLSIVCAIAAAHGGRVDLDTEPGRGSTFTLVLPRAPLPAPVSVRTAAP